MHNPTPCTPASLHPHSSHTPRPLLTAPTVKRLGPLLLEEEDLAMAVTRVTMEVGGNNRRFSGGVKSCQRTSQKDCSNYASAPYMPWCSWGGYSLQRMSWTSKGGCSVLRVSLVKHFKSFYSFFSLPDVLQQRCPKLQMSVSNRRV